MKKFIFLMFLVGIFLTGCTDNNEAADWKVSPTFTKENQVLYGTEGKFGMINVNGPDEPVFPAEQGRLYRIYFLENVEGHSKYKVTATQQGIGNSRQLAENYIGKETEAKFGFDGAGLWKIDVTVDGKPYTNFVVEAK